MFPILSYLFLVRLYGTSAAPVASSFADPLGSYVLISMRDECSNDCSCPGRSVWDIFWSCLATTCAVTWVSVHPNVPWLEESSWTLLKRRILLMFLALLAPEVMVMWAFKQWRGAVMIREMINKARPKSGVQWTMKHAHFLQMGGFKVNYMEGDNFNCSRSYCYETKKEGIVVQEGVLDFSDLRYLLVKQLIEFPDTTAKEIEDRSKGDALSKGVALLQITWFIIQLIARAHQHLTITEIELTTAALAGLNSIMYLFWWSKPLDIRCPIVIRTKELEGKLAEAKKARNGKIESRNEGRNDGGSGEDAGHVGSRTAEAWAFSENEFRLRDYLRDSPAWVALDLAAKTLCPVWMCTICCRTAKYTQSVVSALSAPLRSLAQWLQKTIHCLLPHWTTKVVEPEIELQSSADRPEHSSAMRPYFLRVVKGIWTNCKRVVPRLFYLPYILVFLPLDQIIEAGTTAKFSLDLFSNAKDKIHTKPALQLLFDEPDMNWIMSMMFYSEEANAKPLLFFSALTGAAFGSIHCAAWHFDFPSPVERILWKTASLSIVGLCLFIVVASPVYTRYVYNKWIDSDYGTPRRIYWTRIKRTVETPPVVIYPVARLSLLVLALLSLRRLPPSAFDTVVWTKFIPHI